MSSVIPTRRRAAKFHALVESTSSRSTAGAPFAELLELVADLRSVTAPAPRPEFVSGLRAALMTRADTVLLPVARDLTLPGRPGRAQRPRRRLAIAAGALTFVGATASMSFAAQTALPGDALYPVKRALENAQTGLSSGDSKTEAILDNARERLDEVAGLSSDGSAESGAQVPSTIHDFTEQAEEGAARALRSGDDQQVVALRTFTAASMRTLADLDPVVPDQARDELATAALVITGLDRQAVTACPTCGGAVLDLPPIFLTASSGQQRPDSPAGPVATPDPSPHRGGPGGRPSGEPSTARPGDGSTLVPGGVPTDGPLIDPTGTGPLHDLTDGVTPSANVSGASPLAPIVPPAVSGLDDALEDPLGGLGN